MGEHCSSIVLQKRYFLNAKNLLIKKFKIITTILIINLLTNPSKYVILKMENKSQKPTDSTIIVKVLPKMNLPNSLSFSINVEAVELKTNLRLVK